MPRSLVVSMLLGAAQTLACGPSVAPKASPRPAAPTGKITPAEWEELCEAQSERARKCPGPLPEPVPVCVERVACFGAVVRPDVIRALTKCSGGNVCTRPCSIERVSASLLAPPAITALEDACVARRIMCPALDCNDLVRPVRSLDAEATAPLLECMKYEHSCLNVVSCFLDKMATVTKKIETCGPGTLTEGQPARDPAR